MLVCRANRPGCKWHVVAVWSLTPPCGRVSARALARACAQACAITSVTCSSHPASSNPARHCLLRPKGKMHAPTRAMEACRLSSSAAGHCPAMALRGRRRLHSCKATAAPLSSMQMSVPQEGIQSDSTRLIGNTPMVGVRLINKV